MRIKRGMRVLGVDDGPFDREEDLSVPLVGVMTRGSERVEGILKLDIEVDGMDVTEKLIKAINRSSLKQQIAVVVVDGITFGGMNILDIGSFYDQTELPIVAVIRKKVDIEGFKKALRNLSQFCKRWEAVKRAGPIKPVDAEGDSLFLQRRGLSHEQASLMLSRLLVHSKTPEPLRLAHLIATAIVAGESGNR